MRTRSHSSLHLSTLAVLALFSLGAKPCNDPCPKYPPQGVHLVWNGDQGEVTIPDGAMMAAPNPCAPPAGACSIGPISGRLGVFLEREADVTWLRIDPSAVDLHLGPFDQAGSVLEIHGVELQQQALQLDEATGKFHGPLAFGLSSSQGARSVNLTLAGQISRTGAVDLAIGDASMTCE